MRALFVLDRPLFAPLSTSYARIYFETAEGFEVELGEDAKTWLIRDETYLKVEPANEEVTLEQPLETPVKKEEET